jgi:sugar-phosphatase
MKFSGKRGVLFDLDGTLIDSTAAVTRSWSRILTEAGVPLDVLPTLHGVPSRQSLRRLLPDCTEIEIDNWARKIDALEVVDTEGIILLPGARELFSYLDSAGIKWMIVTSCTRALGTARANAVGITLPPESVFFDDVTRGKPFPEPYLLGLSRLGIPALDVVVLEDAPSGIESGKAAGIDVIAMVTTHIKDSLHEADYIAESLFEIPNLLKVD